jgi:phage terminase large subunit GpA-like protein
LREIMDAVGDVRTERVVCIKAIQVGWTEAINNTVGFYICEDPAPLLLIQPTIEMTEAWSKERLQPMIRDTPALTARVVDPKSRDSGNTIRQKHFPGGVLSCVGANAPASLASRPIRVVLADEVDKFPVSAGVEGNPLALAAGRQQTYWNRKTLVGSTPTIKGQSEIEFEWQQSDQRRYHVPCPDPDCGHEQTLRWENVKWGKPDGEHDPSTAMYMCESCGSLWNDVQRCNAVRKGRWVADKPFRGIAGFHVPAFLSPWVTLPEVVAEFLRVRHDPERLKTWVNTVLGETWEERAEKVDASNFMARRENYGPNSLPEGMVRLTAGVDVQGDRLEMIVVGWGVHEESWAVTYQVIPGDPAQQDI